MKYNTEWMTATLEDIRQFCLANSMPATAHRVAEAIRCAELEEAAVRDLNAQIRFLLPQD